LPERVDEDFAKLIASKLIASEMKV